MKILPYSSAARWILLASALLVITHGTFSFGQKSPPNIAPIHLAADALYTQDSGQKPTLTLALSVEFPTVGAQYRDLYDPSQEYIGYFDSNSCYRYVNAASEDDRRFERIGPASSRQCGGTGFSGSFMNWASSSAIDILRFGLTGGDRIVDTPDTTVLQRAVLPVDFWTDGLRFPKKSVSNDIARTVFPSSLLGDHNGPVYISNCLNRIFFSNAAETGYCVVPMFANSLGAQKSTPARYRGPASGSSILSTDMFFTRVKVCDSSGPALVDPRDYLCKKYPSGYYKPVGNLQKYSDRLRVAAFGYLMDDGTTRYGGVLRAPMTFVGLKAVDSDGNAVKGANPYAEWDGDTGVFAVNPRSASEGKSGVINYLNMFGRTGPTPGVYKRSDPLGELYYESLRYLQGLQPTSQAVSTIDTDTRDGYPVYTSWNDPFEGGSSTKNYACLRNSIVLIGDKFTHADKSLPGNRLLGNDDFNRVSEVSPSNNIPNLVDWTKVVGGFESGNAVPYLDGNGASQASSNPTDVKDSSLWGLEAKKTGATGTAAYYVAGAAYWAHTHDIRGTQWTQTEKQRPGMRVTTYVLDVNEKDNSNDLQIRQQSQLFLTAKYGGFNDPDGDGNPFTPATLKGEFNSRHWQKSDSSGDAKTYFLASNSQAVLKALDDIFASATKSANTISAPAASTKQLTTDDGHVYIGRFDPEFWSGDVIRTPIRAGASGGVVQGDESDMVSAASLLDALSDAQTVQQRKIFVGKSTNTLTGYATEFSWGSIESALQGHLSKPTATASSDKLGQDRLNFIRGYRALEGTTFRQRGSRMGDIINSAVVYSGAPSRKFSTPEYRNFYGAQKNRAPAVFVGANDGMLHAFDATSMKELFAYIPSWLGPKLSLLTAVDYNSSRHTSYFDGTPIVGEAQVGNDWKTVLVSGTGGGGQGVVALDITNPANFSKDKVLWEFTHANDPDLGNVVGTPKIMKIRTSPKGANSKVYKWFAVVPGGINNYVDDGAGSYSTTGSPALFLLDLSKSTSDPWSLGRNYFKISLPFTNNLRSGTQEVDSDGAGTGRAKATGLINFEATSDENGGVQYFYFGDLHGQFWKLDMNEANLSSTASSGWDLARLSYFKKDSTTPTPMYIARTADEKAQPISMMPSIAFGPEGSYLIGFGTGKYLEAADNVINAATQVQSFYMLYDSPGDNQIDTRGESRFNGRTRLQQATVSNSTIINSPFIWAPPRQVGPGAGGVSKRAGWFMDFPNGGPGGGERQVTNAVLFGRQIMFTSLLPSSKAASACGGGASYTYTANIASGQGDVSNITAASQGAPIIFGLTATTSVSDSTGLRKKMETIVLGRPSANGENRLSISDVKTAETVVGRLSWRQINNYRELKGK
ncbi:pilus assembly protein [Paracidovorax anthurii]|uniref:Type IV pilus assembly protein PilY1 n=1 Tax=Paracidovorax anthurii TaxID=78229 RepID=A0A328YRX8_9BURK|nr:PilC/PilY family type IV pilus protein [Paracidovorax anthurii]RAR76164.1 type IV pilus assembly protein PilY1 [Paracidovorax anthurii]